MYEMRFGVPMSGAVLNTINTRLDARTVAVLLRHSGSKLIFVDPSSLPPVRDALRLLLPVEDPYEKEFPPADPSTLTYEKLLANGDPDVTWIRPASGWDPIVLNYTSGTTSADPESASSLLPSAIPPVSGESSNLAEAPGSISRSWRRFPGSSPRAASSSLPRFLPSSEERTSSPRRGTGGHLALVEEVSGESSPRAASSSDVGGLTDGEPAAPVAGLQGKWANLPFDLLGKILGRCSFKDNIKVRNAICREWNKFPSDHVRMLFPADVIPLLLHNGYENGTFKFYDPKSCMVFEVDVPNSRTVGQLCDFKDQKLVSIIADGVHLRNILTGSRYSWNIMTMPSDSYILDSNGNNVRAVIATKGSHYNTTVAVLKKASKLEKTFITEVPFTISALSNPILKDKRLYCISTGSTLGVFDLETNVANIYADADDEEEDDDDNSDDDDDDDNDDGYDDDDYEEEEDEDEEEDSEDDSEDYDGYLHNFLSSAEFLSSSGEEIFRVTINEGWGSVQVKRLEEPEMNWSDVSELGRNAIFTGTRSSIITIVPEDLQNQVFLPGYHGTPTCIQAELVEIDKRVFFCPTGAYQIGTTASPWCYPIGENNDGGNDPVVLENSLWIQLGSMNRSLRAHGSVTSVTDQFGTIYYIY